MGMANSRSYHRQGGQKTEKTVHMVCRWPPIQCRPSVWIHLDFFTNIWNSSTFFIVYWQYDRQFFCQKEAFLSGDTVWTGHQKDRGAIIMMHNDDKNKDSLTMTKLNSKRKISMANVTWFYSWTFISCRKFYPSLIKFR